MTTKTKRRNKKARKMREAEARRVAKRNNDARIGKDDEIVIGSIGFETKVVTESEYKAHTEERPKVADKKGHPIVSKVIGLVKKDDADVEIYLKKNGDVFKVVLYQIVDEENNVRGRYSIAKAKSTPEFTHVPKNILHLNNESQIKETPSGHYYINSRHTSPYNIDTNAFCVCDYAKGNAKATWVDMSQFEEVKKKIFLFEGDKVNIEAFMKMLNGPKLKITNTIESVNAEKPSDIYLLNTKNVSVEEFKKLIPNAEFVVTKL